MSRAGGITKCRAVKGMKEGKQGSMEGVSRRLRGEESESKIKGDLRKRQKCEKTERGTVEGKYACQLAHQQIDLCLFTVTTTKHDTLLVCICRYWESLHRLSNRKEFPLYQVFIPVHDLNTSLSDFYFADFFLKNANMGQYNTASWHTKSVSHPMIRPYDLKCHFTFSCCQSG